VNKSEEERLFKMTLLERGAYQHGYQAVAGVDEAGRGPLAGPVVAAACLIPPGVIIEGVNDSKKLSAKKREALCQKIIKTPGVFCAYGVVNAKTIDSINIYQATLKAMCMAVEALGDQMKRNPDFLLVDGMELDYASLPAKKVIKGDLLSQSIAAASIIAKVTRDEIMLQIHEEWPYYGFAKHKGYGTKAHIAAIHEYGPSPVHRLTFAPLKTLLPPIDSF
jgi:ribonuclease HII